ncbi:MAG: apolipoprotein N-acyltransferase [Desulfurivibrionaceae bacterium]
MTSAASLLAVLLSSLLLYLSSPGPGYHFCAWFGLVPLLIVCRQSEPGKSSLLGFFTGLIYYTLLLRWVTISLEHYGHLPWWLSWIALILLAAYMSLYLSLFSWIISYGLKRVRLFWLVPVLWISLDFIRSFLFSGFPWQDLGYGQYSNTMLIQVADLAGHYGVTFLIVLVNTVIFSFIAAFVPFSGTESRFTLPYTLRQSVAALLLIGAALVYSFLQDSHYRSAEGQEKLSTIAVQASIDQEEKWQKGAAEQTVEKYISLSHQAAEKKEVDLMIWPETAIPFLRPENQLMKKITSETVQQGEYSLLTGMPYITFDSGGAVYYNSALLIKPDLSRFLYHKQHLVPFGEYIPFQDKFNLPGPLVQTVGNFSAGESSAPLPAGRGRLGILICFESIFPELARKEVDSGANLLVNITNDAWFGYSDAPVQHLSMAVFRAVENRRSLARAANTGISCFISAAGQIKQATPLFEPCFVAAELPLLEKKSFYNLYGWLFPHICLLLSVIAIFLLKKRKDPELQIQD